MRSCTCAGCACILIRRCRSSAGNRLPTTCLTSSANFCGYFQINPQACANPSDQAADSRKLDALFGDGTSGETSEASASEDELGKQLEQLFKK